MDTEQDRARADLATSLQRYAQLFALVPTGLLTLAADGAIQTVNPAGARRLGLSQAELVNRELGSLLADASRPAFAIFLRDVFAGVEPSSDLTLLVPKGPSLHVTGALTDDGKSCVVFIAEVVGSTDAERARAAAQLDAEQARAQLAAILDNIPDIVMTLDHAGVIQFINRLLPQFTREQVIGSNFSSHLPPHHRELALGAMKHVLATGELATYEVCVPVPDAEPLWYAAHIGPIRSDKQIVGAVLISRDVTEKKRTESQLIAADRLAAVGVLAAGVAHEINNPLAAIVANLALAMREVERLTESNSLPTDLLDELSDCRESAERIRSIARDLKIFSRSEVETTGPVDAKQIFESTLRMAWNEIRHRARLSKTYAQGALVEANETRLGQVLLNLVLNAAQSIPDGQADANEIRIATRVDISGQVVFEIVDTGAGMSPAVRDRIFDPFFTTKAAGVGTGLGLAISQQIVGSHGGRIEVESELGKGSTFRVFMPSANAEDRRVSATVIAATPARRRGVVLVIDDEPAIGTVIRRTLAAEHEVVTVTRAREALERLRAGEHFDVILCDLMMPEVTGVELYAELTRELPAQLDRVIFMTGGAFTAAARTFLDTVGNVRLDKPFDAAQLRALVNDRMR